MQVIANRGMLPNAEQIQKVGNEPMDGHPLDFGFGTGLAQPLLHEL